MLIGHWLMVIDWLALMHCPWVRLCFPTHSCSSHLCLPLKSFFMYFRSVAAVEPCWIFNSKLLHCPFICLFGTARKWLSTSSPPRPLLAVPDAKAQCTDPRPSYRPLYHVIVVPCCGHLRVHDAVDWQLTCLPVNIERVYCRLALTLSIVEYVDVELIQLCAAVLSKAVI